MLILHDSPTHHSDASPEEMQAIVGEYIAWRNAIEAKGQLVGGEKLGDEGGRVLKLSGNDVHITDGPFAEAKEVVGGFFMIQAGNYDEATEISKGCPHLKYGERIELREIDSHHESD